MTITGTGYKLVNQVVLTSAQSNVTFSSIPSTYTDLWIHMSVRSSSTSGSSNLLIYFNGVTGTSYNSRLSLGDGNGSPYRVSNVNYPWFELTPAMPNANGTFTTNTFANAEMWIQNYRQTSLSKTAVSAKIYSESNIASVYTGTLHGNFVNGGNPVTSITIDGTDNFVAGSTFSLYGLTSANKKAESYATGGNIITTDGSYWYHVFTSSGSFVPAKNLTCDYLIVAGGGGGGGTDGGGGGAGGYRSLTSQSLTGTATITVGAGGSGGAAYSQGTNGVNSSLVATTAISSTGGGKGGGGSGPQTFGTAGGSGGGGAGNTSGGSGSYPGGAGNAGSYSPVEGYAGGTGKPTEGPRRGAGGGGAGGVGADGSGTSNGGTGSNSLSYWASVTSTGVSGFYAGGGGGGVNGGTAGTGGSGGGGNGANGGNGSAGTANTGSGGGGGGNDQAGGAGGSGIVIVRYAI